MTLEEIHEEIQFRTGVYEDYRYDSPHAIRHYGHYTVVERDGWQGVAKDGVSGLESVVPIIYDEVVFVQVGSRSVAVVRIGDYWGAWLIDSYVKNILDCIYDEIECSAVYGGIRFRTERKEGLYSIIDGREIFGCEYEEVTLCTSRCGSWARRVGGGLVAYLRDTEETVSLTGGIEAYDCEEGLLYRSEDGYVRMIDSEGNVDRLGLRRLARKYGGRIRLENSRRPAISICDASGYILNDN